MKNELINNLSQKFANSEKMPVLFLGHGSPMNAIEKNEFVAGFRSISNEIARPKAIICISAHWETKGTHVTIMKQPPTIHDFAGFPKELYYVEYPAPGDPDLAYQTRKLINKTNVVPDEHWGLDHGAWSVIRHMYPNAQIPVIQLSLDYTKPARYHYELARELKMLRHKGILIVGSGNIVHNLRSVSWEKLNENFGYDWALEANQKIKTFIEANDHQSLIDYEKQGNAFRMAIPTPEHYLPLLYSLALQDKNEKIDFFNDKPVAGSISMTSLRIGD